MHYLSITRVNFTGSSDYKQNGVSIGYCSQIAGMTEEEFIKYLGQNEISIFQFDDKEEFLEELEHA